MGATLVGISKKYQSLKMLEKIPAEDLSRVLKQCVPEVENTMRQLAPQDTGDSLKSLKLVSKVEKGKVYWHYEIGFEEGEWEKWKGLWFQNFTGQRSNNQHIDWMGKARKRVNNFVNSRISKEFKVQVNKAFSDF